MPPPDLPPPALSVAGLSKVYRDRKRGWVTAVDNLTFEIAPGRTVGLLGGNGAGKTTTLAILLGLLLPSAGTVRVLGIDMTRARHAALPFMNFSSPYVDVPHRLTVRENLTVYAHLYGVRHIQDTIARRTQDLDLTGVLDRPVGGLSAGQKTRVALAKALLNDPKVLLLDEPTASLDPDTGDWVRGYLARWRAESGSTMVLASHNMGEVERLCDEVMILKSGRLIARATPSALCAEHGAETLEAAFLHIARS